MVGVHINIEVAAQRPGFIADVPIQRLMVLLELFGGLLYTLGSKPEQAPLVPAFTNEKGKLAVSYRLNGIPATYYKNVLRTGSFESGTDLTSDKIKGPGAALLSDRR